MIEALYAVLAHCAVLYLWWTQDIANSAVFPAWLRDGIYWARLWVLVNTVHVE